MTKETFNHIKEMIMKYLHLLSDEQRLEIFREYCRYCGCENPECVCMREE